MLRRYSEFDELYQCLCRAVPSTSLPALPPKLLLNTADALADRYLDLDAFLRSLLSMPTAAAHPRLRSFLGADIAFSAPSPVQRGSAGIDSARPASAALEDDWEHEPSVLSPAGSLVGSELGEESAPRPAESNWLLTGSWVADEARSRDSLEPMLRAMGTPWAARRMVRGLRIVSTLAHEPGVRLVEVASSSLGEGKPSTFALDGQTRPLWMGRREGAVRAVELRRTGAVRLEITLPDGKGVVLDTRRVLPCGNELERIIELRLVRQPPLRLHRLLIRDAEQPQQPVPRALPPAAPEPTNGDLQGAPGSPCAHLEGSVVREAQRQRKQQQGGRSRRLYRHERADAVFRPLLGALWHLLAWMARFARVSPLAVLLGAASLAAHALCSGILKCSPRLPTLCGAEVACDQLTFAILALPSSAAATDGTPSSDGTPNSLQPQPIVHQPIVQVPARTLLMGVDAVAVALCMQALVMCLWRHRQGGTLPVKQ